LIVIIAAIIYYWFYRRRDDDDLPQPPPQLPRLKKQDMTLEQLKQYDGTGSDGRICIAVDKVIFDVTRAKHLYGKDGSYGLFAGKDASRGLATFSLDETAIRPEFDDLSDLSTHEIESMREWAEQYKEKYDVVGRLLKPGEQPDVYTDTDEDNKNGVGSVSTKKQA